MTDKLKKKPATRRDRDDARRLQAAGTHGDTVLAHISPRERDLLDLLSDGLLDGGGRNPTTGLLSFDESDRSDNSNTSAAGENTGGMDTSSPNSGVTGNEGPASSNGGNSGGYGADYSNNYGYDDFGRAYSKPGIANMSLAQMAAVQKQINDDIDTDYGGMYGKNYDARKDGWSSPDTVGRFFQELWAGPAYNAPGRYGMPNAIGPGIFGTALGSFVGGPMSMGMRVGDAMGRAQSPQARDETAASFGAMNGVNSTGQDRDSSTGLSFAELSANNVPGAASGSSTAGLLGEQLGVGGTGTASGAMPTVQPGGLMQTDERERTLTGLPAPIQNLLADYIWRGRQGSGFGW